MARVGDRKVRVMREAPEDVAVRDQVLRAAKAELSELVERIEALQEERDIAADGMKAVYADAKSRGYDTGILRKVVKARRDDIRRDDLDTHRAIFDLYWDALDG